MVHILAVFFYYGFVKTMQLQPGRVPRSWKEAIQQEIDQYLVSETQMISRWKDEKKSTFVRGYCRSAFN
jgi:hypothetical protein